jgi:HAD superfamily hydrolase (TIGR01509 family)
MRFTEQTSFIFDMDGVVIDSEKARAIFLQKLIEQQGIKLDKDFAASTYGRTATTIFQQDFSHLLSPTQIEETLGEYRKLHDLIAESALPIEPTITFIKQNYQKRRLSLASMSSRNSIDTHLTQFDLLDKFRFTLSREDVTQQKPHPEVYLLSAAKLGVRPEDCVAFEDTSVGATAALAANMVCYAFINDHNHKSDFKHLGIAGYIKTIDDYNNLLG